MERRWLRDGRWDPIESAHEDALAEDARRELEAGYAAWLRRPTDPTYWTPPQG